MRLWPVYVGYWEGWRWVELPSLNVYGPVDVEHIEYFPTLEQQYEAQNGTRADSAKQSRKNRSVSRKLHDGASVPERPTD